ncbi:MAG: hypothetical protein WCW31_04240 [Patescibacteria group bacterium]|jgi:hypothetical protein
MKKVKEKEIVIHYSWKKILTIILGALFAVSLVVFLVSLTLQQTVINPQYYKDNLKAVNAYNRILSQGIPSLILETHISDNTLTDSLAKEISILLIQRFVDPIWLEDLTNGFIDNTVSFLSQKDKNIELDLTSAKSVLNTVSQGLIIANEFIPPCDKLAGKKVDTAIMALIDTEHLCKEKGINLDEIKKDLQGIQGRIATINTGVVELDSFVNELNTGIAQVRAFVDNLYIYLFSSVLALLILAGFLVGLYWGDKIMIMRTLSISGGIGSITTLVLAFCLSLTTSKEINNSRLALSASMKNIINDFMNAMTSGIFNRLEIYAGILLVVSVGVYILSHLKHKKD